MFYQSLLFIADLPSIIECMRLGKGEDKASLHPWKDYTAGEVRTLITGKLEETIQAGLIRWHDEDEQVRQ